MRSYCQVFGILNLLGFYASIFWLIGDRTGSGAPAIVAVISFNMAMAWLFLAGIRRTLDGVRVWEGSPAIYGVLASLVLLGLAVAGSR